jgi:hypothetical protein
VKANSGEYKVRFLHPDRSETTLDLKTEGEFLDIATPDGDWSISGLVIQGPKSKLPLNPQELPKLLPRPGISHQPPSTADAGHSIGLRIQITPATNVTAIRLHYRPVNQKAQFKIIEHTSADGSFTIPQEDVSPKWDLMYYFEILNPAGSGWFQPDPLVTTPYYVIKVGPGSESK